MDFETIRQSAFLQTLGSSILNSMWQVFICWLLYESIVVSFRQTTARFRHNLATLLLFGSFLWFLTGFIYKIVNHPSVQPAFASDNAFAAAAAPTSFVEKYISYAANSIPYLSVAYILLLSVFVVKLLAAYRYIYVVSNRRLSQPPAALKQFTLSVARDIGLGRHIRVWISHHIDVPATIGFIKPMILIPFASLNNLSQEQLEAIILHELSHIRRNDYVTNMVISVIETMLFFNPFAALLARAIRRERENCCDDFVLQYSYDAHSYATALMRLEQSRLHSPMIMIGAVSGKHQLLSRIKRITNGQSVVRPFNYGQKLLALLFVTAIIYSLAWISPATSKIGPQQMVSPEKRTADLHPPKFSGNNQTPAEGKQVTKHVIPNHTTAATSKVILENDTPATLIGRAEDEIVADVNPDSLREKSGQSGTFEHQFKAAEFLFKDSILKKLSQVIDFSSLSRQQGGNPVDFSRLPSEDINRQLKWAFQQINRMNWEKIQGEINSSMHQLKIEQLTRKSEEDLLKKAAAHLSKVTLQISDQNGNGPQKKMQQEFRLKGLPPPRENRELSLQLSRAQQVWQALQQISASDSRDGFSIDALPKAPEKEAVTPGPKEVKIFIRQKQIKKAPKATHVFQFSLNNKLAIPGNKSIVQVELTEEP